MQIYKYSSILCNFLLLIKYDKVSKEKKLKYLITQNVTLYIFSNQPHQTIKKLVLYLDS